MNRIVPNSYQTPNLYTDRLMHFLTGDEWKTLHYAMRRTFGWNKTHDRISVSQFRNGNGRLDENGEPMECGTGLSQAAQIEAIRELMRFGILIEAAPNNARKEGRLWTLQLDESQVRFDLLRERHEAQQDTYRRKTARARQAAVAGRAGQTDAAMDAHTTQSVDNSIGLTDRPMTPVCGTDRYRSVGQTDTGLSVRPIPVCGTDLQKDSKKPNGKTVETHSKKSGAPLGDEDEDGLGTIAAWGELVALCDGDEARAGKVLQLQERFLAVTTLKRPDPETSAGREMLRSIWWPNLLQIMSDADDDMAEAEAAMREASQKMDSQEPTLVVASPKSIVNITAGLLAKRRRGSKPRPSPSPARPKGLDGISAYLERHGGARGN